MHIFHPEMHSMRLHINFYVFSFILSVLSSSNPSTISPLHPGPPNHPSIHPSVHPSVYPFIHLIIDAEKALSKFLLDVSYCVYRSTLDSCAALTTNMVSCLVANFCSSVYCIPRLIIDLFL